MLPGSSANFDWDVTARVPARRKEIGMHGNFSRALFNQSRERFTDIRMFYLKKRRFNQIKTAPFTDAARCFTHVCIPSLAPAAVSDDQDCALKFVAHANASATTAAAGASRLAM